MFVPTCTSSKFWANFVAFIRQPYWQQTNMKWTRKLDDRNLSSTIFIYRSYKLSLQLTRAGRGGLTSSIFSSKNNNFRRNISKHFPTKTVYWQTAMISVWFTITCVLRFKIKLYKKIIFKLEIYKLLCF